MTLDQQRWLPDDVLTKADRASMLVSLEMRTPFLERSLAEFAASVPVAMHAGPRGKRLLRSLLDRALPELAAAPRKTAFRVPLARVAARSAAPRARVAGRRRLGLRRGMARPAGGRRALVEEHTAGRADQCPAVAVLAFGCWLDAQRGRPRRERTHAVLLARPRTFRRRWAESSASSASSSRTRRAGRPSS